MTKREGAAPREFYVVTNSMAAPFVSDTDYRFVKAKTAAAALKWAMKAYRHPCGLYAAAVYADANALAKGKPALATWDSSKAKTDWGHK